MERGNGCEEKTIIFVVTAIVLTAIVSPPLYVLNLYYDLKDYKEIFAVNDEIDISKKTTKSLVSISYSVLDISVSTPANTISSEFANISDNTSL